MTTQLAPLAAWEFGDFFAALWASADGGELPVAFDWQRDLVAQLARELAWPDLVDLPTGTGKTSLLEIALFLQALDAARLPAERWMPRRVVLVVDRRVVVDQADDRGRKIADRLAAATNGDGVIWRVASRLRHLSGARDDEPPLVRSVLRGGIVRDEAWARRPDLPALISSTVDQVGSRLLFRGYGISPSMRPVHAGLLANDCLFLLDEVHLARPFAQTLAAVAALRNCTERQADRPARWHVVELSATPTRVTLPDDAAPPTRFPRTPLEPGPHPVLRRRLLASKPARLESVTLPAHVGKADRLFAEACAGAAERLLATPDVTALGVIVNRVSTARSVARRLTDRVGAGCGDDRRVDVVLLTGRMRPIDRDVILHEYRDRLKMGRDRTGSTRPLVVVATQAIEAGADFDLDAIVTECASLDALRQRFGRVDRDGRRSEAGATLTSVVLARAPSIAPDADDPVYGRALTRTWAWLHEIADRVSDPAGGPRVDFGIRALPVPADEELARLVPPAFHAPVMLPAHLDAWVQTNPRPAVEPDVALWLHGIREPQQDVTVVWRDDLHGALLEPDRPDELQDAAAERVRARPPVSAEALSLPIAAVRRWLLRQEPAAIADVDGMVPPDGGEGDAQALRCALRWAGSHGADSAPVVPARIKPGDVLVVPSAYGGIDLESWAPEARDAVVDLGSIASREQRRLAVVRVRPDRWPQLGDLDALRQTWQGSTASERDRMTDDVLRSLGDLSTGERADVDDVLAARHRLRDVRFLDGVEPDVRDARAIQRREERASDPASPFAPTVVITVPARPPGKTASVVPIPLAMAGETGDEMSFSGRTALTLAAHTSGVSAWAQAFSRRLGVDPDVAADVRLAAELHDIGKADPRFQAWVQGGEEFARAGVTELFAKSAIPYYDRAARAAARKASGYPDGARHELTSVAMAVSEPGPLHAAHDPELVLHLLASHHGYCRGFAPLAHDPAPVTVTYTHDAVTLRASSAHGLERIDSGIAERFWRVVGRYGWFGLAWLETILRLADHRRSEEEQDAEGRP